MANSHRARSSVRKRSKKPSEGAAEAKRPNADELRRLRTLYFGLPPNARRVASSTKAASPHARSSTSKKRNASTERKSRDTRKRDGQGSKIGGARTERGKSYSRRRTEDYVYGTSPTQYADHRVSIHHHSSRRKQRPSEDSSSQSSSLSTVSEDDIEPADSVSQSGRLSKRRHLSRPPLTARQASTQPVPASSTASRKTARPSSIFGSLLRRNTTTSVPSPPRMVECLTCGSEDIPATQSAKLECGHRMCHDCLKRIFDMSVKDPAHMPPKCCTDRHIPLKHVDKLFDLKFKMLWNRKYQEYHTKNRIYCPAPKCGEWIKPTHFRSAQGRRFAVCPRCRTKVCVLCHAKLHTTQECPKDPALLALAQQAKAEGWQTCYSCRALVERREGCNHMTCRCQAEFCIVCGRRWKTCECPWFDYTGAVVPEGDRLNGMRVAERRNVVGRAGVEPEPAVPRAAQAAANAIVAALAAQRHQPAPPAERAPPARTYADELDQRRRQERQDADLARRMQLATFLEPDDEPPAQPRGGGLHPRFW